MVCGWCSICGRPGGEASEEGASMAEAIDTHTHLNHPRLYRRLPEVLERARGAGVVGMVVVGYDVESSRLAVEIADASPGMWAAVGVHPHDAKTFDREMLETLRALAVRRRVVAVGETGLDFYRDLSPRDKQREVFRMHIGLARELGLPLIIHCRQAQEEVLGIAGQEGAAAWVWHCFDGTPEQARGAVELGMWVGFAGTVTYRSSESIRQAAAEVPLDRILLETDCPYLSPEPRRGEDNEPANVTLVAEAIARARGMEAGQTMMVCADNARRAFRLE